MLRPRIFDQQIGYDPPSRPPPGEGSSRPKKATTACLACKQRKTKCSGAEPCEQCAQRHVPCVYDIEGDQRRKIANQRNLQKLSERSKDLSRQQVLLGGLIATIRLDNKEIVQDLIQVIQRGTDLVHLAIHIDNLMTQNPAIYEIFRHIDFYMDDSPQRPTVQELLSRRDGLIQRFGDPVSSEMLRPRHGQSSNSADSLGTQASGTELEALGEQERPHSQSGTSPSTTKPARRPWELN